MGRFGGGRPNRDHKKATVYLAQEDRDRIYQVRRSVPDINTDSAAIREALRIATTEPADPTALALEILQYANGLEFMSPKEKRELRYLTHKLYQVVTERQTSKARDQ